MKKEQTNLITLHLRSQILFHRSGKYAEWQVRRTEQTLPARHIAIIVCDMWDNHWSLGAAERVNAMAHRMNACLEEARSQGITIIHAPSDTMDFYAGCSARERAVKIPGITPPDEIVHADFPLPVDDSDGGTDTGETVHKREWTCQHPVIVIDQKKDYISDHGVQVLGILTKLEIKRLLIMGVHINMCILNRSFAIKQMVRWGKSVALVRDLTDSLYNPALPPYVSHDTGTRLIVEYIEKFWCPTITSKDLLKNTLGRERRMSTDERGS